MGRMGRAALRTLGVFVVLGAVGAFQGAAVANSPAGPAVTLHANPQNIHSGNKVTLTGHVTNAPSGSRVKLYRRPFPYNKPHLMATLTPSSTGAFSFKTAPQRNTRYVARVTNTSASAATKVGVFGGLKIKVQALPLGRAGITLIVHHPADLHWSGTKARWFFKTSAHPTFYETPSTVTERLNAKTTELHKVVVLPAGNFRWRVCFFVPGEHALLNTRRPPGCHDRGYYGNGSLPVGFPGPAAISRAIHFEAGRIGRTSFAVMDSEGRLHGRNIHYRYRSASVVKAMLLVAYLRRKQSLGQHTITSYDRSILDPMIEVSDNNAATRCWQIVGDTRLYALAHAAHMTDFSIVGIWANAMISPADQARYFFEMDSLIPREFVGYADYLLSHIVSYESWGIPAVARPRGYQVWFKGGWIPPYLVHQAARLEGHGKRFAMAVMTDGDPSFSYGIGTIQGVASNLLSGG
jgi:hypothetical protein